MKNYSILICFVSSLLFSCSRTPVRRTSEGRLARRMPVQNVLSVKKRVSVLPLFNESPFGGVDLAINAREEILKELVQTGEFLPTRKGKKIFGSSKEVYSGGGIKLAQLSKKAKSAGINLVIFGRILDARVREKRDEIGLVKETNLFAEAKLELRIYDVYNLKEVFAETLIGYADDKTYQIFNLGPQEKIDSRQSLLRYAVRVAARKAIPKLNHIAKKMNWIGRVAKIISTKAYINAGRQSGIQIGDILKVVTEGQEIFDPETGALIGVSKGEVKGTLEVIDYVGPDGAVTILHSGGAVLEGDFVHLY